MSPRTPLLLGLAWLTGCAAPTTPAAVGSGARTQPTSSAAGRGAAADGSSGSPWIVPAASAASGASLPGPARAGSPASASAAGSNSAPGAGAAGSSSPAGAAGRGNAAAAGSGSTAQPGTSGRPGTGPCASDADRMLLRDGSANAQGWVCATGCALDPDALGCITPCLEAMLGLSSTCAACQAQAVACGLNGCTAECGADPDSPECHACVMGSCTNIRC
jgi:hypothetical protein